MLEAACRRTGTIGSRIQHHGSEPDPIRAWLPRFSIPKGDFQQNPRLDGVHFGNLPGRNQNRSRTGTSNLTISSGLGKGHSHLSGTHPPEPFEGFGVLRGENEVLAIRSPGETGVVVVPKLTSNRVTWVDVDFSNSRGPGGNILTGWVAGIKRFPRVG